MKLPDADTVISGVIVLTVVAVVLVTAGSALYAVGSAVGVGEVRGESTYTGVVVDFENEKGFFFQTTQANLKTNPESTSHETFCVLPENRDEQVSVLREATNKGHTVTVTYERPRFVPIWECESGTSIITDVQVHK